MSRFSRGAAIALGCAVGLAASCVAVRAHAQQAAPSSGAPRQVGAAEKETARRLMEQGRERAALHDDKGALEAFKAADDIMHVPTTGLMVANEQVALGMLVEARDTLSRVLHTPAATGEPEAFARARTSAEELNRSIEGRIPSLRIDVRGASTAPDVTVDDVAVSAVVLKFPYRLDPGHHVVVAKTARGTARAEADVHEGETKDVVLQITELAAPPPPEPVAPPPPKPARGPNTLAIVGFSVAGAGVIAGTVTGLLMFSKKSALDDACVDNQCPPSTHSDYDAAYTMATISTISFIVAGVGAGVGIYGLLSRRGDTTSASASGASSASGAAASARPRVEPWISVSGGGLRGSF
jgi:hypothetical protein